MQRTLLPFNGSSTARAGTGSVCILFERYPSLLNLGRSLDDRHVHPAHWFLHRRYWTAFPRPTTINEYEYITLFISIRNIHLLTVWPANLVTCALFNTLHSQTYAGMGTRGGINRERFFLYAWTAGTLWYFVPGYLFQALSYFSWVCWIAPNNIPVNQMFGYVHGMGMSLITFDWAQVGIFLRTFSVIGFLTTVIDHLYRFALGHAVVGRSQRHRRFRILLL